MPGLNEAGCGRNSAAGDALSRTRKYRILSTIAGVVLFLLGILIITGPDEMYELEVGVEGAGRVFPEPGSYPYQPGDTAFLYADPAPDTNQGFVEWRGAATGTDDHATVLMNGHKTVIAVFSSEPPPGREFKAFTLAVSGSGEGTTRPEPGLYRHLPGKKLEIQAVPGDKGYFSGWLTAFPGNAAAREGRAPVNAGPRMPIQVDEDMVLVACFQSRGHRLTVEQEGPGIVLPERGTYALAEGFSLKMTAVPNSGYRLRHWSDNAGNILHVPAGADDLSLNVTVSANQVCRAVFESIERRLVLRTSLDAGARGRTTPASSDGEVVQVLSHGETVHLTATPEDGNSAFAGWSGDLPEDLDNTRVLSPSLDLVMTGDRQVTARFVPAETRLKFEASVDGVEDPRAAALLVPAPGVYGFVRNAAAGIELQAALATDSPVTFLRWEGDLPDGTDAASFSVWLPMNEDRRIAARFIERGAQSVTVRHTGEGSGATTPSAGRYAVAAGRTLILTAVPGEDHFFGGWKIFEGDRSVRICLDTPLSLAVSRETSVEAFFGRTGCTISIAATDAAAQTVPAQGLHEIACGAELNLHAAPLTGKYFHYWQDSAGDIVSEEPDTLVKIQGNGGYLAVLGPPLFSVQAATGGNGKGNVEADRKRLDRIVQGETVRLKAIAAPDSVFSHWEGDLPARSNAALPELSVPVDGNKRVTAHFDRADFTLTVEFNGLEELQGALVLPGPGTRGYRAGAEVRLAAFPPPGGGTAFAGWTGDITSPNPQHVLLMDRDIRVTANFSPFDAAGMVTLTLLPPEGGGTGVTRPVGPGAYAFMKGAEVGLSFDLGSDSFFGGWGGDYAGNIEYTNLRVIMDRDKTLGPAVSMRGAILVLMLDGREGGTVSPQAGVYRLADGLETVLTARRLDDDYVFEGWHEPGGERLSSRTRHTVILTAEVPRVERIAVFRKYLAPPEMVLCDNRW